MDVSLKSLENLFFLKINTNLYVLDSIKRTKKHIYLTFMSKDLWIWHKNLGHASIRLIEKLAKHELVTGLPKLNNKRLISVMDVNLVSKLEIHFLSKILSLLGNDNAQITQ